MDIEIARHNFSYDPESGRVTWARDGGAYFGKEAGSTHRDGGRQLRLDGRCYQAHRIAWLLTHGHMPEGEIDHINGDRGDNRLANLRDVSRSVNLQNQRKPQSHNKSGFLGVCWHSKRGWEARICVSGKRHWLGTFQTPEAAHAEYIKAKRAMHVGNTL